MPDFATTRWSLVAAAKDPAARQALADLCGLYWYPVYAFVRRRGYSADDAGDLTQEFFARLIEKAGVAGADPAKGRFRSYLLGACRHFLANERDRAAAQKRGGGRPVGSLDLADAERRYAAEPADGRTPEQVFERRWALTLLDGVLAGLRAEYAAAGQDVLFDRLKSSLTGDAGPYVELAAELGLTEGAVKVAAHRLRRRYRDRLRAAIAETVATPEDIEAEIRDLFAALSRPG
ncbi:MAG TPA: sigma-70 family RNA polymerase sigma factor [Gemmataceae bacterium]|jgi:RNA polymerase sigma-70 factor (ECF subfamily)